MNFTNLIGKKIRHCFVPADRMSITFVMEDGHRRSLGAQNAGGTRVSFGPDTALPPSVEGSIFNGPTDITGPGLGAAFETGGGQILIVFSSAASLVELPE